MKSLFIIWHLNIYILIFRLSKLHVDIELQKAKKDENQLIEEKVLK